MHGDGLKQLLTMNPMENIKTMNKTSENDSQTSVGGGDLLNHKLTNCEIDCDMYRCSDCTKLLCLEIKNKRKSLDKLYNLVETLNTNNEDIDKCCGVQLISLAN